jgi:hypothetical protein
MDKKDDDGDERGRETADGEFELTDAQRMELARRSKAYRRSPHEAVALEDALRRIERSLG